jgi:hypothetical protein
MDDLERAILYSFDETGAVAPDLKVAHDLHCNAVPVPRG